MLYSSSGLWEDIEQYVYELFLYDVNKKRSTISASPPPRRRAATESKPKANLDSNPKIEAEVRVTREASEMPEMEEIGLPNEYYPEVAATLSEDIEDVKNRYIVGKIVGRNLVAKDGRTIASSGERITNQVIRQAEEAGLLVELIEYMTFESFED